MRFRYILAAFVAAASLAPASAAAPSNERHRGVSWVAGGTVTEAEFRSLADLGADWIVQTPFGWQSRFDSPEVGLVTSGRILWGETDEGLETTARLARSLGLRIMLKPHIWLRDRSEGKWRGEIAMPDETVWKAWIESYGRFIRHYARLAEKNGFEALCIGTELRVAAREREKDWRRLIAEIRDIYHGKILYAANWHGEFEEVAFWDALDYIGIQGYFPLAERESPSVEELVEGWRRHLPAIERVQKTYGKPVVFTEIGYRSTPDAAIEPWVWPKRGDREPTDAGRITQANAYEAFFRVFWDRDWFAGVHFWKWYPRLPAGDRIVPGDFSPQNKPAEATIRGWFRKGSKPPPDSPSK